MPPATSSRQVRRLSLRAASAGDAQRGRLLIEDALHTASLPAADDGRLVVIRRLELGRVNPRASAATLALQIERATRRTAVQAVSATSPGAESAAAVMFPSRVDAMVLLARRLARSAPIREWYWAKALPGWTAGQEPGTGWRTLLQLVHEDAAAPAAVAAVIAATVEEGAFPSIVETLSPGECRRWLQALGFSSPHSAHPLRPQTTAPDAATPRHPPASPLSVPPGARDLLVSLRDRWSSNDARLVWLGTALALLAQPTQGNDPALPIRLEQWLRLAPSVPAVPPDTLDRSQPSGPPSRPPAIVDQTPVQHSSFAGDRSPSCLRSSQGAVTNHGALTDAGGLFFLIPVLRRLGFASWLADRSGEVDHAFGLHFLTFCLQRLGVTQHDPMWKTLTDLSGGSSPYGDADAVRRTGTVPVLPVMTPATPWYGEWLGRTRGWCRRQARIGLYSLVRRPGWVSASRTHLEISFRLEDVDLRIRRSGLDINPGWVPWLGRVVLIHYREAHDY